MAIGTLPQHSARFGFDLPDDFPLGPLEIVHARASDGSGSIYTKNQALWSHWGGGCNGTMYRFVGAAAASDDWAASSRLSTSPEIDERVRQEVLLFSFFTNALSSLECLAYGLSAIGEFLRPAAFPVTRNPRAITFKFTAETFAAEFPSDNLGPVLIGAHASPELNDLRTIRHTLSHRSAPGRTYSETLATAPNGDPSVLGPTHWLGGSLGPTTTTDARDWVARALDDILQAADAFTSNYM